MKIKVFRPHLDDVERLSYGEGAKRQRGTGSRAVCHRLNQEERRLFDLAKQAGYLTVKGTGYRKERKGSPLGNIYRQRCDALEEICVIVEKRSDLDRVAIDFSTLRVVDDSLYVSLILNNIFQSKYPDLYEQIQQQKIDAENAPISVRHMLSKSSTHTKIDVEALKTKAIWAINERVISVICDRDVAKAVVLDVLKAAKSFVHLNINQEQEVQDEAIETEQDSQNENADEIDWDDI